MTAFGAKAAHEVAHAWLGRAFPLTKINEPVTREEIRSARGESDLLLRLSAQLGRLDELAQDSAREETLVALLSARWGFVGQPADPRFQASAARQRVRAEAASLR